MAQAAPADALPPELTRRLLAYREADRKALAIALHDEAAQRRTRRLRPPVERTASVWNTAVTDCSACGSVPPCSAVSSELLHLDPAAAQRVDDRLGAVVDGQLAQD